MHIKKITMIFLFFSLISETIGYAQETTLPIEPIIDIKGDTIAPSQLKGKIIVLDFWFIACGGCLAERPALDSIAKEYKGRAVFLAISQRDSAEQIAYFIKKFPFAFTQILPNPAWIKALDVKGYPTTFIFNKNGKKVYESVGYGSDTIKNLRKELDKQLVSTGL